MRCRAPTSESGTAISSPDWRRTRITVSTVIGGTTGGVVLRALWIAYRGFGNVSYDPRCEQRMHIGGVISHRNFVDIEHVAVIDNKPREASRESRSMT